MDPNRKKTAQRNCSMRGNSVADALVRKKAPDPALRLARPVRFLVTGPSSVAQFVICSIGTER